MNNKQFQLKIFFIFFLPAIALLYFSSIFVLSEYEKRQKASTFKLVTKVTSVLNKLIHNLQIERGLSSGYIVANDTLPYKHQLLEQFQKTDRAKNNLLYLIRMTSQDKDILTSQIGYKIKPLFKEIIQELFNIKSIRDQILNHTIDFKKEIKYYSNINTQLIKSIKIFTLLFEELRNDADAIVFLQKMKEYAGLERAYTYYLLVANRYDKNYVDTIINLQRKQKQLKERFFLNSSLKISDIYLSKSNKELEDKLKELRRKFLAQDKVKINSKEWFTLISSQIDIYNAITIAILEYYNHNVDMNYEKSLSSLYVTIVLWSLAFIALFILFISLKKLMYNEEQYVQKLDTTKNMYQLLSQINDAMIHIDSISDLYQYFAKILYDNSNSKLIWIGLVDEKQANVVHEACATQSVHKKISLNFKIDKKKYSVLSLAAKSILDKSILFADKNEIKHKPEYNNLSIFNSINSVASFPINNENNIIGSIVIFSDKEYAFDGEYISVVERIIDELSFAISKISTQDKRKKDLEALRISAYAFDTQEAMTITDAQGNILKVNRSFCEITGYTKEEVLGKNPRILQSDVHPKEFYKDMWDELILYGRWHGEIYNKRKNGEIFPEMLSITAIKNELKETTHYIAQFIDISSIKQAQEAAQYQADHDFLTGLLNRKSLTTRLQEEFVKAKRHDFVHAFLFIDLDNFKSINDTYGHNIGDKIIMLVAQRLKEITREGDILSRLSGDEFAVILLNIDKKGSEAILGLQEICNKIIATLNATYDIDDLQINTSSSIGINLFPNGEKSINDIMIHADKAMYKAKKQGKNQFVFFGDALELQPKNHARLEA